MILKYRKHHSNFVLTQFYWKTQSYIFSIHTRLSFWHLLSIKLIWRHHFTLSSSTTLLLRWSSRLQELLRNTRRRQLGGNRWERKLVKCSHDNRRSELTVLKLELCWATSLHTTKWEANTRDFSLKWILMVSFFSLP